MSVCSLVLIGGVGCSTPRTKAQQEELDSLRKQVGELGTQVGAMSTRMDALEGKVVALGDRLPPLPVAQKPLPPKTAGVTQHPAEGIGTSVAPAPAASDPEPGFVNDDAVQEFRRAMVYFEAGRYPEAIVGFAGFLEKYPDHPFAGSAQFYVGESYFNQKDYPKAYDEFQRVITTYDRSSHIAATLRDLAEVEEHLQKKEDAARHRHLLNSLFPQAPAAQVAKAPSAIVDVVPEPRKAAPLEEVRLEPAPGLKNPAKPAGPPPTEDASRLDEPPPPTAP